jgi:cytochrome c oxidase subunit 2
MLDSGEVVMNSIVSPAKHVDQAFLYILGFSVIFLIIVTVVMIYFVFRYQRSRHPEPEDIRGNWKLEVAWTIIPTVIALSMFYFGWTSYMKLRNVPPSAIEVDVEAQKWTWLFIYSNDKESENLLVVPEGKPIKLNISSLDVIHSLFIPAFRVKVDAVKGMDTYVWFYADKAGTYDIMCAEYCGKDHAKMRAVLKILPEGEFEKWLEIDEDDE